MTSHISPGAVTHPTFPAWAQLCAGKHTVSNNLMADQVHTWDWISLVPRLGTGFTLEWHMRLTIWEGEEGDGWGMGGHGKDEGEEDEGEGRGGEGRGG